MIVLTFQPHAALRPHVAQYLFMQSYEQSGPSFKMVPRNYPVFIFTSPEMPAVHNLIGKNHYPFEKGSVYYSGLGTDPSHMHIKENSTFIVVLLKPSHTGMFLREKAVAFTNHMEVITHMNPELRLLNEQLWQDHIPVTQQINLIESYLIKLIHEPSRHFYILRAMDAIHSTNGRITVNTLAEKAYTCPRNLQRLFREHVGVNPKEYVSMVRFNSFMKEFMTTPNTHIELLSEKYNYYDLSHLNKTFNRYLGTAPTFSILQDQTINKLLV